MIDNVYATKKFFDIVGDLAQWESSMLPSSSLSHIEHREKRFLRITLDRPLVRIQESPNK